MSCRNVNSVTKINGDIIENIGKRIWKRINVSLQVLKTLAGSSFPIRRMAKRVPTNDINMVIGSHNQVSWVQGDDLGASAQKYFRGLDEFGDNVSAFFWKG